MINTTQTRWSRPSFRPSRVGAKRVALLLVTSALVGASFSWVSYALNNPDNMVPADANPGGGGYVGQCTAGSLGSAQPCQTDNRTVTWYVEKGTYSVHVLETADIDVVKSVIRDRYALNTVLDEVRHETSQVSFSGPAETDIIYEEGPVPGTDSGYTWCENPTNQAPFYACDQQYIRIEPNYVLGLTCHETGHAVGLLHGLASSPNVPNDADALKCMKKPTPSGENLGTNNQDNINATY